MQRIQLSVIEDPKENEVKTLCCRKVENDGVLNARGMIKNDIDEAIGTSIMDKQFFYKLREKVIY